ncbi:MAG: hypothetical protein A2W80_07700 [Candidatus Riflebacteria bacterium GWC2_50_8]|nr:MAG: hypothetical protein A2W80_07700 [Candidatus Riflebacteria bacterium GWC2_50_8]
MGLSQSASAQSTSPFAVGQIRIANVGNSGYDYSQINASAALELTDEEKELLRLQLLPVYYPILKRCLESKEPFVGKSGGLNAAKNLCKSFYPNGNGHYSRDFGNPVRMLDWAKRYRNDKKMCEIVTSSRRGDVYLVGPQKQKDIDTNFICLMTKGPYYHASMVIDSVPPIIIEAVGITANRSDTTSDKVRMSTWYEEFGSWAAYRLVRPTHSLPAASASAIIEKAVAYAEAQLGKPYDYAFSNSDGDKAFYCSELVSKAYTIGAGFQGKITEKNPERDKILVAFHSVIDGLEPKNKYELSDKVMQFAIDYSHYPDVEKLQKFIIDEFVPGCKVLEKAFPDKKARSQLNTVFNKIKSNEGFAGFAAANKSYEEAKKAGKFNAGWGIGKLRELKSKAAIGIALLKDIDKLGKETGASRKDLMVVLTKVFIPVYQNLGTFGEVLGGMNKNAMVSLPEGVKTVLKIVDWGVNKREEVKKWPVIGSTLARLMPGNGDGKVSNDITSPSDLAQASPGFTLNYP